MQQYLIPPHKIPDEDKIQEGLLQFISNPDIKFILRNVKLPKKYKLSYWFIKVRDKIVFSTDFDFDQFDKRIHIRYYSAEILKYNKKLYIEQLTVNIIYNNSDHGLLNKISHTSFVESICTFDCRLNASSFDQIAEPSASASAKYCTSFKCGAIALASSVNMLNCSNGMKSISSLRKRKTMPSSSGGNLLFSTISSMFLPSSKNRYSGDTNSNLLRNLFTRKIIGTSPFDSRADIILLASTIKSNEDHFLEAINLSDRALSTFSEILLTSFSESLDFDNMDFTSNNLESSFFTSLLTTRDHSTFDICFNSSFSSSGTDIVTSGISITICSNLNVFKYNNLDGTAPDVYITKPTANSSSYNDTSIGIVSS